MTVHRSHVSFPRLLLLLPLSGQWRRQLTGIYAKAWLWTRSCPHPAPDDRNWPTAAPFTPPSRPRQRPASVDIRRLSPVIQSIERSVVVCSVFFCFPIISWFCAQCFYICLASNTSLVSLTILRYRSLSYQRHCLHLHKLCLLVTIMDGNIICLIRLGQFRPIYLSLTDHVIILVVTLTLTTGHCQKFKGNQ